LLDDGDENGEEGASYAVLGATCKPSDEAAHHFEAVEHAGSLSSHWGRERRQWLNAEWWRRARKADCQSLRDFD